MPSCTTAPVTSAFNRAPTKNPIRKLLSGACSLKLVEPEPQARPGPQERRAQRERLALPETPAQLGQREQRERQERLVQQGPLVQRALRGKEPGAVPLHTFC